MPSRAERATEERLAYAVIREDARLEGDLVNRVRAKRVLTVASGGCVALSLASRFPGLEVTAFDTSSAQLDHLAAKAEAARKRDLVALNVENASSKGLNQCGELEKVFRHMRAFFEEFIASHGELVTFFTRARPLIELDHMVLRWTTSRYWRAAFHACFTDVLLKTTLGSLQLRHADEGTHPAYFQRAFERGLRRDAAPENPFLQHVFLGGYRRGCEPYYVRHGGDLKVERVHATLLDVPDLEKFDIVSLSNLFDALSDEETALWAQHLKSRLRPGAAVLIRQLNNTRKLRPFFEPEFRFDAALGRSYFLRDRSLFYNRIEVGTRQADRPKKLPVPEEVQVLDAAPTTDEVPSSAPASVPDENGLEPG